MLSLTETDDKMRAFAEKVFASETKDENIRDEISMFDVAEDCPILHTEMAHHLHHEDDADKRWDGRLCIVSLCLCLNKIMSLHGEKIKHFKVLYSDFLSSLKEQLKKCHCMADIHSWGSRPLNLISSYPQQEAPAQPHNGRARGHFPGNCCPCSVSGGGHAHLPGSAWLPESGHHRRLRLRGTLQFPLIPFKFTGEVAAFEHLLWYF